MDRPPPTFLIILLLFIFFAPNQQAIRYNNYIRISEDVEKHQDFDALANSTYGDLTAKGLNLTGFRDADEYHLELFPKAQELSRQQYVEAWYDFDRLAPTYHDIEGRVKGDFKLVDIDNLKRQPLNLSQIAPGTDYLTAHFDRNVTDSTGQLSLDLHALDKFSKYTIREVKADLSIFSESSPGDGWQANVRGLQFPSGLVVMTTMSRKFNALAALPHFTLSEQQFERATLVMNRSLTEIWRKIDQTNHDDNFIVPAPKCELVVWLHQKPMLGTRFYIDEIEQELLEPDGAPVGVPPPLAFSATVMSPDCGFILQADTVHGPKVAAYNALWRRLTAAFCIILAGQIVLLRQQTRKCATPSTRSRVSYHTFGIAAFGDGLVFCGILGSLVIDTSSFVLTGVAAFLAFLHFAALEVRFIFDIWTVQVGEPAATEAARQRRTNNNTPNPAATAQPSPSIAPQDAPAQPTEAPVPAAPATPIPLSEAGLPLPATAPTVATSNPTIILSPDQNEGEPETTRTPFASLYSRFYFAMVNLMFLTLWALSWPATVKHVYFNLLAFSFLSMWVPQIYRNVMRNCRKALDWEFVIGTSMLRAIPVLYWYIDEQNVLWTSTNYNTAIFLFGWLWLQILVLLSQQYLGPRLFVPASRCPPAYDYHPILYDDLEAGGLPIGEITSASEGKDKDTSMDKERPGLRKVFDCAICMNEIDVPVVSKDEKQKSGSSRSWLEQRMYMVTPCRHIFHSECLEGWMNLRLACPVCRESLPPL